MHNQNLVFTFKCTSCGKENKFEVKEELKDEKEPELELKFLNNFSLKKLKQIRLIAIIMSIVIAIATITYLSFNESVIHFFMNFMSPVYSFCLYVFISPIILILFFSASTIIAYEVDKYIRKRKLQ